MRSPQDARQLCELQRALQPPHKGSSRLLPLCTPGNAWACPLGVAAQGPHLNFCQWGVLAGVSPQAAKHGAGRGFNPSEHRMCTSAQRAAGIWEVHAQPFCSHLQPLLTHQALGRAGIWRASGGGGCRHLQTSLKTAILRRRIRAHGCKNMCSFLSAIQAKIHHGLKMQEMPVPHLEWLISPVSSAVS